MKRVGVREFRDHATQYLAGDEVLAIERHGQPIGFYIPTGNRQTQPFAEALGRLERTVARIVAETGLTEENLSRLFDLSQPLPELPQDDMWTEYDPDRVRQAIQKSAGGWAHMNTEALIAAVSVAREEGSRPTDCP
jgi:hypothetical protein